MRNTFLFLFVICLQSAFGQGDFLSVHTSVIDYRLNEKANRDERLKGVKEMLKQHQDDTAYYRGRLRSIRDSMDYLLYRQLSKVINVPFPDMIFNDKNNRHYSISDFRGTDIAIVFNNMYCEPCFYLTDTTLHYIGKKNVKVIALFIDDTQNETTVEKAYNENVIVGFIKSETKDFISLTMGDSFAYYLDSYGNVRFFDGLYLGRHESAWVNFLNTEVR